MYALTPPFSVFQTYPNDYAHVYAFFPGASSVAGIYYEGGATAP
jgi:hypothetical protein